MLAFCISTGIGEKIKLESEEAAEDARQRAIRCTKEVIEREESQRREEELARLREEWKVEKQQLFLEAHQNQLRAIARHTIILENKLKEEFQEKLAQIKRENIEHLERTVNSLWEEAEAKQNVEVAFARGEERQLAEEESRLMANMVAEEENDQYQKAEEEKARALEENTKLMEGICQQALVEQHRDLDEQHRAQSQEMSEEYESRLAELNQQLSEEAATNERLMTDLREMRESRDDWELQYRNLKMEFTDFIDQFPGFSAEFILK